MKETTTTNKESKMNKPAFHTITEAPGAVLYEWVNDDLNNNRVQERDRSTLSTAELLVLVSILDEQRFMREDDQEIYWLDVCGIDVCGDCGEYVSGCDDEDRCDECAR